jgi:hypothetical protein
MKSLEKLPLSWRIKGDDGLELDNLSVAQARLQPGQIKALTKMHLAKQRCECQCAPNRPKLLVRRTPSAWIIARMPHTEAQHSAQCAFAESFSIEITRPGKHPDAIDFRRGIARVNLGISLKSQAYPICDDERNGSDLPREREVHVVTRTTLAGFAHLAWERAKLNAWTPCLSDRRSWLDYASLIMQEANRCTIDGVSALEYVYPLVCESSEPEALEEAHLALQQRLALARARGQRVILVGPVADAEPTFIRFAGLTTVAYHKGSKNAVALKEQIKQRCDAQPIAWAIIEPKMPRGAIMAETGALGMNVIEMHVLFCTRQLIPTNSRSEAKLLDQLVSEGRSFIKPLLPIEHLPSLPSFIVKDGQQPVYVDVQGADSQREVSTEALEIERAYVEQGLRYYAWSDCGGIVAMTKEQA